MLDLKRNKRIVTVEQTWEQRRVVGILLGMRARPESPHSASCTLALWKVETSRVRAVIPAPASCEGAGIQERNAGSPHLQEEYFFPSFLLF